MSGDAPVSPLPEDHMNSPSSDSLAAASVNNSETSFLPLIDETVTMVVDTNGILSRNSSGLQSLSGSGWNSASPSPVPLMEARMGNNAIAVTKSSEGIVDTFNARSNSSNDLMVPPNTPAMPSTRVSVNLPTVDLENVAASVRAGQAEAANSNAAIVSTSPIPTNSKPLLPFARSHRRQLDGSSTSINSSRIKLGICAMDKKARSKPMSEILSRLDQIQFEIIFFGDDMILNKSIDEWPNVDVLIAFYSGGYPLEKAEEYVAKYEPYVLNDLGMQHTLKDRRKVYDLMEENGLDTPRHVYVSRDGYVCKASGAGEFEQDLEEHDDSITVNGVTMQKPFVEKPVDADDHNICIYYPQSAGGGCKKLFRKIGDRSSEFYPEINEIRRDGSYIYEEFVETQGVDVKMYTVGPDYGHAEARKSPTVDGKVVRDSGGKEVRFPVILTQREKVIARKIVLAFKQQVCGFDLLRVQEGDSLISYCCDVNGWSFVKNSRKYYDDCAQILTETMLAAVKPKASFGFSTLNPLLETIRNYYPETPGRPKRNRRKAERLISLSRQSSSGGHVIDVSEKDKGPSSPNKNNDKSMNNAISSKLDTQIVNNLEKSAHSADGTATPKRESRYNSVDGTFSGYNSCDSSVVGNDDCGTRSSFASLSSGNCEKEELRCVITVIRHGDRSPKQKLKIKVTDPVILEYFHKHASNCMKDLKIKDRNPLREFLEVCKNLISDKEATSDDSLDEKELLLKLQHMRDILEKWTIGGLNRKLQLKPQSWDESVDEDGNTVERCTKLLLILKWGGNLTKLGEKQAICLGQRLRQEIYPDQTGGGILRLHSTFRHDLKIKTSDEGRVMKTAAAFAKGMLELEGDLPPILISLVHKEKSSIHMLDPSGNKEVKKELSKCKNQINEALQGNFDVEKLTVEQREGLVGPRSLFSIHKALKAVGNPREKLQLMRDTIGELISKLEDMLRRKTVREMKLEGEGVAANDESEEALSGIKLYKGETLLELTERWRLLYIKLYDEETNRFDLSRVPDVHDNVRFDMLHNPHLGLTLTLTKLYELAKLMADIVVPQEYGVSIDEKKSIGSKMCRALLEKIKYDMIIARTDNFVDMRYMINMEYAQEISAHINTLGRRVRTRLYFTSESHLHTLLNVLRFNKTSLLSSRGREIVSMAPELCYLTQIVFRLFENTKKDIDDPKRFRVEIQFSPGATATPSHMSELERDHDSSRFDTDPLQVISKDHLTAVEVEDFFTELIKLGKTEEDDEGSSAPAIPEIGPFDINEMNVSCMASTPDGSIKDNESLNNVTFTQPPSEISKTDGIDLVKEKDIVETDHDMSGSSERKPSLASLDGERFVSDNDETPRSNDAQSEEPSLESVTSNNEEGDAENNDSHKNFKSLTKGFLWRGVAAVSLIFGIGCLAFVRSLHNNKRLAGSKW